MVSIEQLSGSSAPAGTVVDGSPRLLVWDSDAPCGTGQSYIHNIGTAPGVAMTAGAGPRKHTYMAGYGKPIESLRVGTCGVTPVVKAQYSWTVTRAAL